MRSAFTRFAPTLGKKIALAVTLTLLVAGGTFVSVAHITGAKMLQKQARAQAHAVVEVAKAILDHVMMEGENDHLEDALQSAVSAEHANEMYILGNDGRVLLGVRGRTPGERVRMQDFREVPEWPGERFRFVEEAGVPYEHIVSPIVKRAACYRCHTDVEPTMGYVAAKISIERLRTAALEHRTWNSLMTVLTFAGLGVVLYLALSFLVVRPVESLRREMMQVEREMERVEQGERLRFVDMDPGARRDEIASLILAFNRLVHRAQEAYAKVHALHHTQLEQADRIAAAGEMAAGIAHEIRNPLSGVLGALQVFDADTAPENPRKEILREMIAQLNRINATVSDLLSYVRPAPLVFEDVSPNQLIERTLSLLAPQFSANPVEVEVMLDKDTPVVRADRKLLQQLLWNILLNAFQAVESGGKVIVQTQGGHEAVRIVIHDSGKGIPEMHRPNVFKPFFTTKHKGTGLGLAISKRIVVQHGGSLTLESGPGQGTTATIILPLPQNSG